MCLFIQEVVVISKTDGSVFICEFVFLYISLHHLYDIFKTGTLGKIRAQGHLPVHGNVSVRIYKRRHQTFSF